jgi:hypothetical protein
VPLAPREEPVKADSIIELLQSPEIEFDVCPKLEDKLDNFNTGFGENNDLHFEDKCKKPSLKIPLYKENYLGEFVTPEEKAAVRRALGLYNGEDVISMSLLTAVDEKPSMQQLLGAKAKQMRKGNEFFTPYTSFKAVIGSDGKSLDENIKSIKNLITANKNAIDKIQKETSEKYVTSLGDIRKLLKGFKNGDNLHDTITEMNQEMLRFTKRGEIK